MRTHCWLCADLDREGQCFVKRSDLEYPVCRKCWEQLLLCPERLLRSWRTMVFGDGVPVGVPSLPVAGREAREEESA
ncbi:MAG TPA: hypothetical protein VMU54_16340 [Planctomycetota bacterium]|nr:hypothetical protein [Planctomycetota bacterium]